MKELSIEEKAKAYDEALKVLHKYDGAHIMFTQDLKEEMFPELAESEDEKIRKRLLFNFEVLGKEEWGGLKVKDICAWFYKQSEQKPTEWKQENVEELNDFENAMMHIGGSFFGEHQGLDPNNTACVKEQAKYLLELAQNSTEWSEEEESTINEVIMNYESAYLPPVNKRCEIINRLKSLRPNHWKPSEEQLYALSFYATSVAYRSENQDSLRSLFEDLNKL